MTQVTDRPAAPRDDTSRDPGLRQSWQGRIESLKPATGFLNVITPDFYLHPKGDSVGGWQQQPGRRVALDHDGRLAGLALESGAFA